MSNDARQRIEAAYDPRLLALLGQRLVDELSEHLHRVQNGDSPALNWHAPADNIRAADAALDAPPPTNPEALLSAFTESVRLILGRGQNLHSPRYIGHQVPPPVPLAGLFDAIGSVTNQVMAIYEMGPFASAVEAALVERLGQQVGLPAGQFAGFVTHGGSLANLTALLTARNVALPNVWERGVRSDDSPVIVVHAEAHYCIARSAGVLGLGTAQVVRAELDSQRRIDPARLDANLTLQRHLGRRVVAVVACACATPVGAFDPLDAVADVCQKHGVWMHVDAAHGGAAAFSPRYRQLVAGLERADSFIWDAHKMLHVPALCAFVFYRNREHRFEAFRQEAPYLFDPAAPGLAEFDVGLKTVECTKRAAAFGLWGLWRLFGPQLFADIVEVTFDLGRQFHAMLVESPDFQPLHEPQCNIVVFRHVPVELRDAPPDVIGKFQLALRRDVIESGEFYLVPTQAGGVGALRATLINPLTRDKDLAELLDVLRRRGRALLPNFPRPQS